MLDYEIHSCKACSPQNYINVEFIYLSEGQRMHRVCVQIENYCLKYNNLYYRILRYSLDEFALTSYTRKHDLVNVRQVHGIKSRFKVLPKNTRSVKFYCTYRATLIIYYIIRQTEVTNVFPR